MKLEFGRPRRYRKTLHFISSSLNAGATILDVGTRNDFSEILIQKGYFVQNTSGEDLDFTPEVVARFETDVALALEILEHLINPLGVLQHIKAKRLIASIPLSLWFARAYRNLDDRWDQHFHEFEDWQFDWLLEKAGWEIVRREKWTSPIAKIGLRPVLRLFTPRYYIVEAVRKQ
jgi:hypothetical protein